MYATSARMHASSGAHVKLVWDVLPPRPRCGASVLRQDDRRLQHAPHAVDVSYLSTAVNSIIADGMPTTYLATTVSAGLLVLAGIATAVSQAGNESSKEDSVNTPAATDRVSSPSTAEPDASAKAAHLATTNASADVLAVREWISAYRVRESEPRPASAAPVSFALPDIEIAEAEAQEAADLVEKINTASPEAVAAASAALGDAGALARSKGIDATADSSSSAEGSNKFDLLAWLKALWAAIVKFFQDMQSNKGSGAPA